MSSLKLLYSLVSELLDKEAKLLKIEFADSKQLKNNLVVVLGVMTL